MREEQVRYKIMKEDRTTRLDEGNNSDWRGGMEAVASLSKGQPEVGVDEN
jgi:hypothetical protein